MSRLRRLAGLGCAVSVAMALAVAQAQAQPRARPGPDGDPPPQSTSRGENFSEKPPAQLFASDCTGAGCHKGPQGLAKNQSALGLTSFLRQHYTNSQKSAAALASYLAGMPAGPDTRATRQKSEPRPPALIDAAPKSAEPRRPAAAAKAPPRGRQATAEPAATPPPPPEPPAATLPPAPPPPQTFDIFD